MRLRPHLLACGLLALVASAPAAAPAQEEDASPERPKIYKWIDENGIAHYTTDRDRIPSGLRRRAERLGGEQPALEREPLATRAPAAASDRWAVRDRAAQEPDVWDEGALGAAAGVATASAPAPLSPEERAALSVERSEVEERIAELESTVAEDEGALKAMIANAEVSPLERGDDPQFRAIALRLPKHLAELRALRDRREQLESP